MANLFDRLFRSARPLPQVPPLSPAQQEINTLLETAKAALEHGFPKTALEAYQRGLTLARTIADESSTEQFLSGIGAVHVFQNNFDDARPFFEDALDLARKLSDPRSLARCLNNLGTFHFRQNNWGVAQTFHQQALNAARESGQADVIALTLENLAQDYLRQDNPGYAQHLLKEAVVITQAGGQFQLAPRVIGLLAEATLAVGDSAVAQKLFEQAIYLAQRTGQGDFQLRWLKSLARLEMDKGQYTPAISHLQEAENLALRLGNQPSDFFMSSALDLATAYRRVGNSAQAEEYATRALAQARSTGSAAQEAQALTRLGMTAYAMSDYDRAYSFLTDALTALRAESPAPDPAEYLQVVMTLSKIAMRRNQFADAERLASEALELARAGEDEARQAEVQHLWGSLALKQGQRETALSHWQAALNLLSSPGSGPDYAQIARLRCDIAQAKRDAGDFKAAMDEYEKALVLLNQINHRPTWGMVKSNAATLYSETGDIETAKAFYEESIEIARATGDRAAESLRLGNLGWFFRLTGRPMMAVDRLEQAIKISRDLGDTLMIAVQSNNLACAYTQLKDYDTARGLHKQALAAATALNADRWMGVFQSDLGATMVAAGRLSEAEPLFISALERAERSGDLETLLRTQARQAKLLAATGRLDEAAALIDPVEGRARKVFFQRGIADVASALGDIARLRGDDATAQKHYAEALRLYNILHDPAAQDIAGFVPTS